jgi:hypothetical protein
MKYRNIHKCLHIRLLPQYLMQHCKKNTQQKVQKIHIDNLNFLNPKTSMGGILVTTGIILHKHAPRVF